MQSLVHPLPLLSFAEKRFRDTLLKAINGERELVVKPRMADCLGFAETSHRDKFYADGRHFDFVICTSDWIPEMAVELDDASHDKLERRVRDEWLRRVCSEARLPLARFRCRRPWFTVRQVQFTLGRALNLGFDSR